MADVPNDKEMQQMAIEEMSVAVEEEKRLQLHLLKSLLPKDKADEKDCILEVRAGTLYTLEFSLLNVTIVFYLIWWVNIS